MKIRIDMLIANILYFIGFKPNYSTGICGRLTKGYGKLDYYGYWQFPLKVENNKKRMVKDE